MKPIIINMNEMSDSVEVYQSKPNPFLIYTIYSIFFLLLFGSLWMYFFTIDDVVKSEGMFKSADSIYDISSGVSGKISDCKVENGSYVEQGDTLYVVSIDSLSDTISSYQNDLMDANNRLEIIDAYDDALSNGTSISDNFKDNQYYEEFVNRRTLLMENIESGQITKCSQQELYQKNIDTFSESINKYEEKINNLQTVKTCIKNRKNEFETYDSYYYSIVSSYISSYDYTKMQYDNEIENYQSQIIEIEKNLEEVNENISDEELQKQKENIQNNITYKEQEEHLALNNLETTQIANIEQMIENLNDNLTNLNTNLQTMEFEYESISNEEYSSEIAILTEKGNIANERLTYVEKKQECEDYLKSYNIKNDNCTIVAPASGYFYGNQELKKGSFLQEGCCIGSIYPERDSEFYAEIYVENSDIGKISEGQEVKFEIDAFPSNKYGYFSGEILSIPKDITLDEKNGCAYYVVKVKCKDITLQNREGDIVYLKNGMSCIGKIVIGKKTIMNYLLEKINLLD